MFVQMLFWTKFLRAFLMHDLFLRGEDEGEEKGGEGEGEGGVGLYKWKCVTGMT